MGQLFQIDLNETVREIAETVNGWGKWKGRCRTLIWELEAEYPSQFRKIMGLLTAAPEVLRQILKATKLCS